MAPPTPRVQIQLRDVKYDIRELGVHGASYYHLGSDPRLEVYDERWVVISEYASVHTAPFRVMNRRLNVVEAYGGMEDLHAASLPEAHTSSAPRGIVLDRRHIFPRPRGEGSTLLPIIIPIASFSAEHAFASLRNYRGAEPLVSAVRARSNVQIYVDWEMTDASHKLLFDSPAFHVGLQGQWQDGNREHSRSLAGFALSPEHHDQFLHSLHLVRTFDQQFVRVALSRVYPAITEGLVDAARERYREIDGERLFGHEFDAGVFQEAIVKLGERVLAQPGMREYYGLAAT